MDKRTKKRIDLLNKRIGQLHQKLKGAKEQTDEPTEISRIEDQIASAQAELAELKK